MHIIKMIVRYNMQRSELFGRGVSFGLCSVFNTSTHAIASVAKAVFQVKTTLCLWFLALVIFAGTTTRLAAQNTTFTYQGKVTDNGTNFTGAGQFKFALVSTTAGNSQATATAIMGGTSPHEFVQGFNLTSGGSGYTTAPSVVITGGSGSDALAQATISGGMVTGIIVINPGFGFISAPMVTIDPPTANINFATQWSNDGTSSGGSEPVTAVRVAVTNGLFTVLLGDATIPNMLGINAGLFSQPNLQLRIWFNDGVNGFSPLNPPHPLTAAPYAAFATSAASAGSATTAASAGSVRATNIIGTLPASQLPATVITNGANGVSLAGNFTGNGAGLTGVTASALSIPPGMALIPGGTFTMGDVLDGQADAIPTNVTVSAFFMDVNLVSYSQWQSVYFWATSHGYVFDRAGMGKAANHPVYGVDWYDAVKWSNARSQQAGLTPVYYTDAGMTQAYAYGVTDTVYPNWAANGYRLPTEAEYEKAARGGLIGQRFPWGNVITENLANYVGIPSAFTYDLGKAGFNPAFTNGVLPYTSPVGYFTPNGYGLYDMLGNLSEWCWDWYGAVISGGNDPRGPSSGTKRLLRGGSWDVNAHDASCGSRPGDLPSTAGYFYGFRCARRGS